MSAVRVAVHIELDRYEPDLSEAMRVSRAGRPDVMLARNDRHPGVWDSDAAERAAISLARAFGLDPEEAAGATVADTGWADETADPRWQITFEIEEN